MNNQLILQLHFSNPRKKCELCNGNYYDSRKKQHLKSLKHLKFIADLPLTSPIVKDALNELINEFKLNDEKPSTQT